MVYKATGSWRWFLRTYVQAQREDDSIRMKEGWLSEGL